MLFIHISSIAPVIPSRKNTWFGGEPETFILKLFFYQEEIFIRVVLKKSLKQEEVLMCFCAAEPGSLFEGSR